MRIVTAANFVAPRSGGIKTVLTALAKGYAEAGHDPILVLPGERDGERTTEHGTQITVAAPRLPGSGCYRMIADLSAVRRLLDRLAPDRLEVDDKFTLAALGTWARGRGVPSVAVSHERLDSLLALRIGRSRGLRAGADRWNRRFAASFDTVVCTTAWAAQEFERIGTTNLVRVPLGVDLEAFGPERRDPALRARFAPDRQPLLMHAGRLSPEKRPTLAVEAVRALHRRGIPAVLMVAGDGPLGDRMRAEAAGLPVHLLGHVADRGLMASLLATADITLAPGPVETFGLAALESLASGTPVVAARSGAVGEMLAAGSGVTTFSHPTAIAAGVRAILDWPTAGRRAAARRRAEAFPWSQTVERMLAVHRATPGAAAGPGPASMPLAHRPGHERRPPLARARAVRR